ncbi:MAG: hypothetical protein KIT27_05035 [Legionellales bacterium]|nr:hypothetical protein [Legionellales bacterium]
MAMGMSQEELKNKLELAHKSLRDSVEKVQSGYLSSWQAFLTMYNLFSSPQSNQSAPDNLSGLEKSFNNFSNEDFSDEQDIIDAITEFRSVLKQYQDQLQAVEKASHATHSLPSSTPAQMASMVGKFGSKNSSRAALGTLATRNQTANALPVSGKREQNIAQPIGQKKRKV